MAGEGRVVRFQVQLEVIHQAVLAEEIEARGGVGIVLVRRGFAWLRLDVELAGEADLFRVVHGEVEQVREVVELALHVGVEKRRVALASAPERVTFAAEFQRAVHRGFHLRSSIGEDICIRRCAGSLRVTRMRKEAGGAPKELFPGGLLETEEVIRDFLQGGVGLREVAEFGGDVAVVPAVVIDAHLIEELEEHVGALQGVGNGVGLVVPWHQGGRAAEGIGKAVAHDVPVGGREARVLLHRFPADDLIGIVLLEREGILGLGAFELDLGDIGEERHGFVYGDGLAGARAKRAKIGSRG